MVRIPQIQSVETAVRIFYQYPNLQNRQIRELFGNKPANDTVVKLKNCVRERMNEKGILSLTTTSVDTRTAYEVWGLDIDDLEKRYSKLKKYGFIQEAQS